MESLKGSIFQARVNSVVGSIFLGTFALGAALIMWQTAFSENPIANAMAAELTAETQLPN